MQKQTVPIETKRLVLVEPAVTYAADVHAYSSDPSFCEYIEAAPSRGIKDATAFLNGLIADNRAGKRIYWLIVLDGRAIGYNRFQYVVQP